MKILELRALRGPNYYNNKPVIFMKLDLGELEEKPSDLVPSFRKNLENMIPTIYNHTCSIGEKGGFLERIERGTWAGHIAEHIAIELQNLIGHHITYGKSITLKEKGHYNVVFRYLDENVGLRAAEMAVELVEDLFNEKTRDIKPLLEELVEIEEKSKFGPSTQAIVDEAKKRGIGIKRLNKYSYVQLGEGKFQRRIEATLTDKTSSLGVEIAQDKERTKIILKENGIPVPEGRAIKNLDEIDKVIKEIGGYPLVIKPLDGNHGRGITTNIENFEEVKKAFEVAKKLPIMY